jgi:hypothetical protein
MPYADCRPSRMHSQQIRNVAPESTELARRALERRSLTISRNPAARMMTITLEVPLEDGELVSKAIDRAVEVGEADLGPEFGTSGWRAQQADARIAVARSYLSGDADLTKASGSAISTADHYQVVVHVDESALRKEHGQNDDSPLRGGVTHQTSAVCADLPVETVRRLIRHWANGGETSLENLTLLCTQHHRLLHEGQFAIRRDGEGVIYFERSDGRAIPRGGYRREDFVDEVREAVGRYGIDTLSYKAGAFPSESYLAFNAA